ncbi:prepilin-type N-terminal cleavage/methylation domain-containing protein [Vibrio vulnificus]|uniref:prepilin-type N-terminal cleavage/methylation domain-containing protein n=1 Tax=Vibrio vulnificus TaxID=672 RepID=UPI001CDC54C7|nr:prepilin-type N-terminal cleavage/methylation domain-containing protein [Vibrio vulnificus]MCA3896923.1 prepilin-type N-terminal cleavage/methylation domain-containing protein [Vibrio vulnificus]
MRNNNGYSLIELVVVIVVIGILSVAAVPKFMNIQSEAREARLYSVRGALESGINMAHGMMMLEGKEHYRYVSNKIDGQTADGYGVIPAQNLPFKGCEVDGSKSCAFIYGYPDADENNLSIVLKGILGSSSLWKVHRTENERGTAYITPLNQSEFKQCSVRYQIPLSQEEEYRIDVLPCA